MAIGINHATANIELREKFAIAPEAQVAAIQSLCSRIANEGYPSEAVILSTCNRTEIIVGCTQCENLLHEWLVDYCGVPFDHFKNHLYVYTESQALHHLIKVGSGMDSMVLGEPQILGQMKSAYALSRELNQLGSELQHVFQHVFSTVKRIRTNTAIGENPVSVAYAAVALAERIFSDIKTLSVLLIGAGETIELVGRHVKDAGVNHIAIANRTIDKAWELASKLDAKALLLVDLPEQLSGYDVIISSTASQLPILGKGAVEQALKERKYRPMFFVDIAVPRDIESQVNDLADAYLYTIDDLKNIIDNNLKLRANEASKATEIISEGVRDYEHQLRARLASDLVIEYRENVQSVSDDELEKALQALQSGASPQVVLEGFARGLTRKLMHVPSVEMRNAAAKQDQVFLDSARVLLGLGDSNDSLQKENGGN